jgi:predicted transcriptional regulator|nr:ArsR family transcriptional regulator [uncultured Methanoregula sp.]
MRSANVMFFTDHEEEFARLLIGIGLKKNIAKVLVYLANAGDVTSRDMERGTDLRQPEVSLAMQTLLRQKWVTSREPEDTPNRGRPVKIYSLARPISAIIGMIEKEKKQELNRKLQLASKLREYVL